MAAYTILETTKNPIKHVIFASQNYDSNEHVSCEWGFW